MAPHTLNIPQNRFPTIVAHVVSKFTKHLFQLENTNFQEKGIKNVCITTIFVMKKILK